MFFPLHHLVMFLLWSSVCKFQYVSIVGVFFPIFFPCPMIILIICYWCFVVQSISVVSFNIQLIHSFLFLYIFIFHRTLFGAVFVVNTRIAKMCNATLAMQFEDRKTELPAVRSVAQFLTVAWTLRFLCIRKWVLKYHEDCILQILFKKYWKTEKYTVYCTQDIVKRYNVQTFVSKAHTERMESTCKQLA